MTKTVVGTSGDLDVWWCVEVECWTSVSSEYFLTMCATDGGIMAVG